VSKVPQASASFGGPRSGECGEAPGRLPEEDVRNLVQHHSKTTPFSTAERPDPKGRLTLTTPGAYSPAGGRSAISTSVTDELSANW
jgi:hypothetical protein